MVDYSNFIGKYFLRTIPLEGSVLHRIAEIGDDRQIGPDEFSNEIIFACGERFTVHGLQPNVFFYESFAISETPSPHLPRCDQCCH